MDTTKNNRCEASADPLCLPKNLPQIKWESRGRPENKDAIPPAETPPREAGVPLQPIHSV